MCDAIVLIFLIVIGTKQLNIGQKETSQHFQDLRQEVEDLVENIKRLRTDREENLTTVNDQVQKHIMKVQNLRSNINKHLDKLEEAQ
jgi:archaellum component FlaC